MVAGPPGHVVKATAPCWQWPLQVLQAMRRSSLRPDAVSVDAAITAARSWRVALELMESLGEPEMATRHWEDQ